MSQGDDFAVPAVESEFHAPDAGEGRTPYACSFHWFRLSDGRICGMDVIRSEDSGQLGLRAFVVGDDGEIRHLVTVGPASEWALFHTDSRPDALGTGDNVLGRGVGWVAGHARNDVNDRSEGAIGDFRFDLDVEPETPGLGTGHLGLALLYLTISDFRRVRTTGTVIIDGTRYAVDATGPCSIHYGKHLPQYAYLATVPRAGVSAPALLLASASGDDLRFGGKLLDSLCATYAYGENGVPDVSMHIGEFQPVIQLGHGRRIELSQARRHPHHLIGMPTITGSARAVLVDDKGERLDLGIAVFDYRGTPYLDKAP